MSKVIGTFLGKRSRQKLDDWRDRKVDRLYGVGARLLADSDYELISIVRLTRDAKVSIGAFYERFQHKDNFIGMLITLTFQRLAEEAVADLAPDRWQGKTKTKLIQGVVHHVVAQLGDARNAGILRAAIKLGTSEPSAWRDIQSYRTAVADCAVELMALPGERSSAEAVRTAMQIVFATVIDAALLDSKPLRFASSRMVRELSELVARYLGVAGKHEWKTVTIDRGRLPPKAEQDRDADTMTKEALRALPPVAPRRQRRRRAVRVI
jgi:AcrR family transcriptional regulator